MSQDVGKITMPGRKDTFRLYSESGHALVDLIQRSVESSPQVNEKVLCRHPFQESKRAYVIPSKIESLLKLYWEDDHICQELPTLQEIKAKVQSSLKTLRSDIKRNLNPTPFKVSTKLSYTYILVSSGIFSLVFLGGREQWPLHIPT